MFSWKLSKMFKNNFFTEHLRTTNSGHFHSLNNLFFMAIQWTNRNQAFLYLQTWYITAFKRDEYHELGIWKTLRNKRPIEAAVRLCFSEKVFLKISQDSHVFSREIYEMFKITFFYNSPPVAASCPSYCCIRRRIFLRYHVELVWLNWLTFIYTCWIFVFYPAILHLKVTEAGTSGAL